MGGGRVCTACVCAAAARRRQRTRAELLVLAGEPVHKQRGCKRQASASVFGVW